MKYLGWILFGVLAGFIAAWFWQEAQYKKNYADWTAERDSVIVGISRRADSLITFFVERDSIFRDSTALAQERSGQLERTIGLVRSTERTLRDSLTTTKDSIPILLALVETVTIRADTAEKLAAVFKGQMERTGRMLADTRAALAASDSARRRLQTLTTTIPKPPVTAKFLGFLQPPKMVVGLGAAVGPNGKTQAGIVMAFGVPIG